MKRWFLSVVVGLALLATPALAEKIKVGIAAGDGEIVWAKVSEIAAKHGLDLTVIVFNDYLLPNAALDAGDLDANAFQHKPFLENQIKTRGYKITPVGETIVAPIGTPEQVVDQFLQLKKAGIDGLQLSFFDFKPDLDFFGRRVLQLMEQAGLRIPSSRTT
ncbi:MetQ/NlpA family ABC transporter substrate-binding protein [Bradyrhizobium sp. Arg237L]|uniref:MetQ/NlpA family ABC transporter substrate-binding protein n=1 Tax=Bradyrhizobium sp. Arg237L TaxID=3003352 RepID=UPI00249DCBA1|nr:MetQ/NlpA family ABC transporter substrate-binding protein [Bradyrhizobium sp. Arg237L]MDI4234058.1 MetQ/NlpA family ABC transporter substrate-binding protein [Bradyrhizobium sp. Arg237L]